MKFSLESENFSGKVLTFSSVGVSEILRRVVRRLLTFEANPTEMNRKTLLLFLVAVLVVIVSGCAPRKNIPNTNLEDNEENRIVARVLENYRLAMEAKNAAQILSLVSPDYYDTSGTPEPADDYDYKGLQEFLEDYFSKLKTLRLNIFIDKLVEDEDDKNKLYVDFRYVVRYQMELPGGDKWKSNEELKRMTLVRANKDSPWLIQSGL